MNMSRTRVTLSPQNHTMPPIHLGHARIETMIRFAVGVLKKSVPVQRSVPHFPKAFDAQRHKFLSF